MKNYRLTPEKPTEKLDALMRRAGIEFDFPCAGNHTCGKCRVKVSGEFCPAQPSELAMLSDEDIKNGMRMACFANVSGPVTVEIPETGRQQIATDGFGTLRVSSPMMEEGCCGAAIDIGTTTLVCKVYDSSGVLVGVESELNAQQAFGADVISRINYGIQNGNEKVHEAIVGQIEKMLSRIAARAGIGRAKITHAVVTGNTTMMHFFAGLDPKGIGFVPFIPQSLFNTEHRDVLDGITAYIPPCVSAYVGADLVCCVLASGMYKKSDTSLIIDIGTNGEMALMRDGLLHCCSTAAGPAFEGAGISHGMVAAAGAISHVRCEDGRVIADTIDNAAPKGICGSGVVDTIAVLIEQSAILPGGRICRDDSPLAEMIDDEESAFTFPGCPVAVTQGDIRQIQLAKAAISAGVKTLFQACDLTEEAMDVLCLCGGFGSFLNLAAAETIGLIPENSRERTLVLGNGAIMGAAMLLLDADARNELGAIISAARYIELSGNDDFMDNYVEAMSFGELDDE